MLEVEVKFRKGPSFRREKLLSLGFSFLGEGREVDIYFQHPCRDFASTDEALRVRLSGGRVVVTYKGPRIGAGAKTRFEVSTVADESALELLKRLGFVEVARVVKRREYFRSGDYLVSLDWVEGLGEFVEIEKVVGDESEIPKAVEELRSLAADLGLEEEVKETYLELVLKVLNPR